jgi:hypothetical protein
MDTRDELISRDFDAAARKKKTDQLRRITHDLHSQELQSVLRLTVGVLNTYCEM